MTMKRCTSCATEKPQTREYFYGDRRCKSGLRSDCKECVRARSLARSRADPAANRAKARAWRKAHPEQARALRNKWNQRNPEKRRASIRRWHENHPEAQKAASARYWLRHGDRLRAAVAEWRLANPEAVRTAWRRRRARKRAADGTHSAEEALAILSRQKHRCAYCRARLTERSRQLDHIIPLARGGADWPSNLQWLCGPCNREKSALDPIDYAQFRGLLI